MKLNLSHHIKTAFKDFKRNKVRTFLTSLGILIGVFSVVLLIALGVGLKNYLEEQFESLGANLILVFPGNAFSDEGGAGGQFGPGFSGGADFDEKDVIALQKIREIDYITPAFFKSSVIEYKKEKYLGYVEGVNEQAFELLNVEPLVGKLFTESDVRRKAKVTVLGFTVAEELFSTPESALGKTVEVSDQRFKIIGVAKKKGDREQDTSLIVPYRSTYGKLNPDETFFSIYMGVKTDDKVDLVKQKAKEVLLKRYEKDDFSVTEQAEILSTVNQIFTIVNSILVAIGSISLLVGGIGIMNIMYASVTERTKEVGIRRAIGATKSDILNQFLAESVILSFLGGAAGLLLATIVVAIVRNFFPAAINLLAVVITFGVSSAIGIFFGVFPAKRAANLPPISAIRYE
jgi:putative ABC transport system permease protein